MVKKPDNKKSKLNGKIKPTKKVDNKKINLNKETKQKSKGKKKLIISIIIVITIICIIGYIWFSQNSEVFKAQLVIESGIVQVKHEGESWISAENGMLLYKSDSIRTGDNSSASIIFFKTSIVRLDSNTEVNLKELIKEEETSITILQSSGRTWNTINKISGIDNYNVQTPTTVASVRGTAFVVVVWQNGSTYYGVSHGILNVSRISNNVIKDTIDVSGNESVYVFIDMINESLEIMPFIIDEWTLQNLLKDEQFLMDLKAELYSRIKDYIPEIKKEYGINDEEIDTLIEGYILGYIELPADSPKWIMELFKFY